MRTGLQTPLPRRRRQSLEAVEAVREHDVEDDHVVGSGLGHPECFCSASGDVGGVPLFT